MLKSVSGIDVEALIKGLTQTKGKPELAASAEYTGAPVTTLPGKPKPAVIPPAAPVEQSEE
jgi:flotillin